jgi:hypothetical protein
VKKKSGVDRFCAFYHLFWFVKKKSGVDRFVHFNSDLGLWKRSPELTVFVCFIIYFGL